MQMIEVQSDFFKYACKIHKYLSAIERLATVLAELIIQPQSTRSESSDLVFALRQIGQEPLLQP